MNNGCATLGLILLMLAATATTLTACGRRSDPRPPEGEPVTWPQRYPNQTSYPMPTGQPETRP